MKSNEQFLRKCVSNLPRLKGRDFNVVFAAKKMIKVMNIRPSTEEQLTNLFTSIQSFLIDHELIAIPMMGEDGDLFVQFDKFHFEVGPYSLTAPRDFLESVYSKFCFHPTVESLFPPTRDPKTLGNQELLGKMGIQYRQLKHPEGVIVRIRRYVPGPRGFNDTYQYHTTPWTAGLCDNDDRDIHTFLDVKDVVVVNEGGGVYHNEPRSIDITFGLPVARFLEICESLKLEISPVNTWGGFTIKHKF
jgi:hypothetical protein